jgi:putative peptidoglycan lipid II flippase
MSRATGDLAEIAAYLRSRLTTGLRRIAFFVIPSAVAFIALGDIISAAIYQRRRFTHDDSIYTWGILAGSGVGLLATTQGRLFSSAFYALKDTRTPLVFAVIRVALTTVLGYLAAFHLPALIGIDAKWGAAGLTASAGVSGWIEFLLLRRSLGKRIGSDPVGAAYLARLWASAVVSACVAWVVKLQFAHFRPELNAAVVLLPYGLLYLLLAGRR